MAGSFENLDNILRDWGKESEEKSLVEAVNRSEKQEQQQHVSLKKKT